MTRTALPVSMMHGNQSKDIKLIISDEPTDNTKNCMSSHFVICKVWTCGVL